MDALSVTPEPNASWTIYCFHVLPRAFRKK